MKKKTVDISFFLFLVMFFFLNSCKTIDVTGKYIICPWNCNSLTILNDSSYRIEYRPEFGDKFYINGTWIRRGKCLTLRPIIKDYLLYDSINNYWFMYIDSLKIAPNLYRDQVDTLTYLIKRNKLIIRGEDSFRKCCYNKLNGDGTKNSRIIDKNRRNSNRKIE